jgi:replicative DNA helicase
MTAAPCDCWRSRPVPASPSSEKALLGILLDRDGVRVLRDVLEIVTPDDLVADPGHRFLLAEIDRLATANPSLYGVDFVVEELVRTGQDQKAGGALYVFNLHGKRDVPSAALSHARRIADFARRRRTLALLDQLERGLRAADDLDDVLEPRIAAAVVLLGGGPVGEAVRELLGDDRAAWESAFRGWAPPKPAERGAAK